MKARVATNLGLALLGIFGLAVLAMTILDARHRAVESERRDRASRLLDEITSLHQPLSQASLEFEIALEASLSTLGQDSLDTRETLAGAYQTSLRAAENAVFLARRLKAVDSPGGAALITAERRLLQQTRHLIRTDFTRIVALLSDDSKTAAERNLAARAILEDVRRAGQQHIDEATAIRQRFVKEFRLDEASR